MNRVNVHVADGKQQQFIPILGTDFKSVVDHVLNIGASKVNASPLDFLEDLDVNVFVEVDSDWIENVGYNFLNRTLIFQLKRGDLLYFAAGPEEFQTLIELNENGESVGEYYHSNIKSQYSRA